MPWVKYVLSRTYHEQVPVRALRIVLKETLAEEERLREQGASNAACQDLQKLAILLIRVLDHHEEREQ